MRLPYLSTLLKRVEWTLNKFESSQGPHKHFQHLIVERMLNEMLTSFRLALRLKVKVTFYFSSKMLVSMLPILVSLHSPWSLTSTSVLERKLEMLLKLSLLTWQMLTTLQEDPFLLTLLS